MGHNKGAVHDLRCLVVARKGPSKKEERKGYTRLDRGHPQTCRSPQDLFLHRQDMLQPSKHSWATTRETSMTCGVWWSLKGPSEKEERLHKTGLGPPTDMPIATRLVLTLTRHVTTLQTLLGHNKGDVHDLRCLWSLEGPSEKEERLY